MGVTPLELARVAAMAADGKKAEDICLIDLTGATDVCDYFLICTGQNKRLVDSVIDEVEERVRINCEEKPLSIEGRAEGNWVLMDYGTVVIHVFTPETREFFRLEKLWGDAPRVDLGL
ncbi:MAG: ribosome silencing factor [Atopobiaceae bacterium]|nr:ribosome silencing factor [Atopobiaceae bacterium]